MRNRFDEQLGLLNKELLTMGALIEQSIKDATKALLKQDVGAANEAIASDKAVDQKERDIETLCLKLLLQQQPVASDLRLISAAMKMITDMERIGDQAADISEIVTMQSGMGAVVSPALMRQLAKETVRMVHSAIDAYVADDVDLAREVMARDDVVDDLFTQIKRELIEYLGRDASLGQQALDLLMIAKYYERIGDHAVNIGEWVEFSVTGRYKGVELQ